MDFIEGERVGVCCLPDSIPVNLNWRADQNPTLRYGRYRFKVWNLLKVSTDVDLLNDRFPSANGRLKLNTMHYSSTYVCFTRNSEIFNPVFSRIFYNERGMRGSY